MSVPKIPGGNSILISRAVPSPGATLASGGGGFLAAHSATHRGLLGFCPKEEEDMALARAAGSAPLGSSSPTHPAASVGRGQDEQVLRPELSVE